MENYDIQKNYVINTIKCYNINPLIDDIIYCVIPSKNCHSCKIKNNCRKLIDKGIYKVYPNLLSELHEEYPEYFV